jgi:thymidylate synthase (FAD)
MQDPHFRVHLVAKTELQPEVFQHLGANGLAWLTAHRCVSEELSIVENPPSYLPKTEQEAGERLGGQILMPGHFGVLEAYSVTIEVVGFPHDVMAQHRTHRVGASFAVTSSRYTGQRILDLVKRYYNLSPEGQEHFDCGNGLYPLEVEAEVCELWSDLQKIFYARPAGSYTDRSGKKFEIKEDYRVASLLSDFQTALAYYHEVVQLGYSEETARNRLAQSLRQSYFVTLNTRSILHQMDLRLPKNAQWEIRQLFELLFKQLISISPEISTWYEKNRYAKNKISP